MFGIYNPGRNANPLTGYAGEAAGWRDLQTGQKDRAVNRGPAGTNPFLANQFTAASRRAELGAYERIHVGHDLAGNQSTGRSQFALPPGSVFTHPDNGVIVQPATDPTTGLSMFTALDGEFLKDQAQAENERREYFRSMFQLIFASDDILVQCTSRAFLADTAAGMPARGTLAGMPPDLVPACCTPSVLFFLPESSEAYAKGVSKASWMLLNHRDMKGVLVTGGKPDVAANHPRGGKSAIEEAVA